jgi:hypothetical protein
MGNIHLSFSPATWKTCLKIVDTKCLTHTSTGFDNRWISSGPHDTGPFTRSLHTRRLLFNLQKSLSFFSLVCWLKLEPWEQYDKLPAPLIIAGLGKPFASESARSRSSRHFNNWGMERFSRHRLVRCRANILPESTMNEGRKASPSWKLNWGKIKCIPNSLASFKVPLFVSFSVSFSLSFSSYLSSFLSRECNSTPDFDPIIPFVLSLHMFSLHLLYRISYPIVSEYPWTSHGLDLFEKIV